MTRAPTNYWDYIKTEQLLSLQAGLAHDDGSLTNDEVLFISVHQIDELWFKLILRELEAVRDRFAQNPVPEQQLSAATRGIRRTVLLFANVAQHFALMETMTTRDYLAFRDKLSPASGFQSAQMREIEVLMGLDDGTRIPLGHEHSYARALRNADGTESPASRRLAARLADGPTLKDALYTWLHRTPIQGSQPGDPNDDQVVGQFVADYGRALRSQGEAQLASVEHTALTPEDVERLRTRINKEVESACAFLQASDIPSERRAWHMRLRAAIVFIESYRDLPLLAWPREIVDGVIAMEQASVIFRQRHARMVERVIGRRTGTGGSAGVEYLDTTALNYRVFGDIWAVRTLLLPETALPPVLRAEDYGFVHDTD